MKDSLTLKWMMDAASLQDKISLLILKKLHAKGHSEITANRLVFLSQLECGDNHAADVARTLGVSRQMVAKHVKELTALGYLQQEAGKGKQNIIQFTSAGEQLIAGCRDIMVELDHVFIDEKINMQDVSMTMDAMKDWLDQTMDGLN